MVLVRDALDLQLLGRAREFTIGSARRRKGRSFIEIEVLSVPLQLYCRILSTLINDQRYAGLDLYHRIFFSFLKYEINELSKKLIPKLFNDLMICLNSKSVVRTLMI